MFELTLKDGSHEPRKGKPAHSSVEKESKKSKAKQLMDGSCRDMSLKFGS